MNRYVTLTLAALVAILAFAMNAPDAVADHAYAETGCGGAYAEAYAGSGCASGPLRGRQPVRRIVRGAIRVAVAPARAFRQARFAPSRRFGCGG